MKRQNVCYSEPKDEFGKVKVVPMWTVFGHEIMKISKSISQSLIGKGEQYIFFNYCLCLHFLIDQPDNITTKKNKPKNVISSSY